MILSCIIIMDMAFPYTEPLKVNRAGGCRPKVISLYFSTRWNDSKTHLSCHKHFYQAKLWKKKVQRLFFFSCLKICVCKIFTWNLLEKKKKKKTNSSAAEVECFAVRATKQWYTSSNV